MKKAILIITVTVMCVMAACHKPESSHTYVHTQKHSQFNFTFNGHDYSNIGDSTGIYFYGGISSGVVSWAGDYRPSRQVAINFQSADYTFNIRANTLTNHNVGLYKIGYTYNDTTYLTYNYGSAYIMGIGNGGMSYSNILDTLSSYVIVTDATANETKGTFVLKATSGGGSDTINVTGNFDLLTP